MDQGFRDIKEWKAALFAICLAMLVVVPCSADCGCSSGDSGPDPGDSSSDSRMEQAQALVANGTSLLAQGRFDDALESYNASIGLDPLCSTGMVRKSERPLHARAVPGIKNSL